MAKWSSIRPSAAVVKIVGLGWVLFAAAPAKAQLQNLYPDFFDLQPNVLDVLTFGGGFGSEKYGSIQEGVQLDQRITRYIVGPFPTAAGLTGWGFPVRRRL